MRLTSELINSSVSCLNPVKERELGLRGHKISAIENMGAARDNDAIDLTDNDITHLGNFPLYPRLRTLFLAQNRIAHIQSNLSTAIPNLSTLALTNNQLAELADLEPLKGFKKLESLSLLGNPITKKEHYRYFVIWLIPSLHQFDFQKVKEAEKKKGAELFGTDEEPTELAKQILGNKSKGFQIPAIAGAFGGDVSMKAHIWTDEEKRKIRNAIQKASSLAEMAALEKDFAEGRISRLILEETEKPET